MLSERDAPLTRPGTCAPQEAAVAVGPHWLTPQQKADLRPGDAARVVVRRRPPAASLRPPGHGHRSGRRHPGALASSPVAAPSPAVRLCPRGDPARVRRIGLFVLGIGVVPAADPDLPEAEPARNLGRLLAAEKEPPAVGHVVQGDAAGGLAAGEDPPPAQTAEDPHGDIAELAVAGAELAPVPQSPAERDSPSVTAQVCSFPTITFRKWWPPATSDRELFCDQLAAVPSGALRPSSRRGSWW